MPDLTRIATREPPGPRAPSIPQGDPWSKPAIGRQARPRLGPGAFREPVPGVDTCGV